MRDIRHLRQAIHPIRLLLVAVLFALTTSARAEVRIQEVTSDSGVTAWLVEDYSVPIIAMRFDFDGGSTQDPAGKEGLARLMTGLFDEGAGDLDREAFQSRQDEVGAEMRFGARRDTIFGSIRMLAERREEAFGLLALALSRPRFDEEPLNRIRAQMVAGIRAAARDPDTAAQQRWTAALYGDHPYARQDEGTEASLAAITVADVRAMHAALFARKNLTVAVVGAIDAATVKHELDRLFGSLPEEPALTPVADIQPRLGQTIHVEYDLPQTSIQLVYPALERADPDFFAAYIMTHILGGGTFSSRLFDEVRERRGLAYGISASLVNLDHASALAIGTSTRSDRAQETLAVTLDVVRRLTEEGPTAEELAAAKRYITGSYALNNLDTSGAIANTLVALQKDDLGIDYIQRRAGFIDAVTLEQVKAQAAALLTAQPAVLIVGPSFVAEKKG